MKTTIACTKRLQPLTMSMISFVTFLKIDLSDIPLIFLPFLACVTICFVYIVVFSFVSAYLGTYSVVQAFPLEVTGNNTGLAWRGIPTYLGLGLYLFVSHTPSYLISTHSILAGPAVFILPCPFISTIIYLILCSLYSSPQIPCSI